jgi:predicted flap endonuclease-1-like 5' DNA nuclease
MKIEFPILESEPLIYFLLHSGVFVFALASLFFLLGMCMGAAIWGRYKKHLQHMKLENIGQLQEIAVLKRKLAEQTMRPSTSPLNPPPALLTEVLPNVSEIFPERTLPPAAKPTPAAPPAQIPAVQTQPAPALVPATLPVVEPVPAAQPVSPPAPASKPKTATIRRPTVRVKSTKVPLATPAEPAAPSAQANGSTLTADDDEVAPFGFLIGDAAEPLIPSSSVSALAAIIKAPPIPVANPVDATPAPQPTSPSVSVIPTVLPEFDPALGLVYKITPPDTDDLTRIKGIASVLEKRLHDLGVYTWRQIASWEERHIREFSSRLAFKDRIVREKWVEQARSLNEARQLI